MYKALLIDLHHFVAALVPDVACSILYRREYNGQKQPIREKCCHLTLCLHLMEPNLKMLVLNESSSSTWAQKHEAHSTSSNLDGAPAE